MSRARYYVNIFDGNGESRGSFGFTRLDAARKEYNAWREVIVYPQFMRLWDSRDQKQLGSYTGKKK